MTDSLNNTFGDDPKAWVQTYYGEVLKQSSDLQTNACCATGAPPAWLTEKLAAVHPDISNRFYGCGYPIPEALTGRTVVDLGCGTGRDVFVLSQCVGEGGRVIGVDMTEAQLSLPRDLLGWHADRFGFKQSNTEFVQAYIEDLSALPLDEASVDVFVSNCVVNLSPRKDLVLREAHRLLREGGEFYLSDVVADRRLPESVARDPLLYSECLGGAMYDFDFVQLAKAQGFLDPREVSRSPVDILSPEVRSKVGAARFFSVTYRLFKLPALEARCEDYGQVATYRGGLDAAPVLFTLDDHHVFERGRPERVCNNTAQMLAATRLGEHFTISGDTSTHYGVFDCSNTMAQTQYQIEASGPKTTCC